MIIVKLLGFFITPLGLVIEMSPRSKSQEHMPGLVGKEPPIIKHLVHIWMGLGDCQCMFPR